MQRRALLLVVTALVVVLAPAPADAKIPPMDEQELAAAATLIVTGKVTTVAKDGAETTDSCYHWQPYQATFAVETTHKGDKHGTVTVRYDTRLKDRDPKDPCDGGHDSYSLQQGGRYKLYLRARGAIASPFHRDGVRRL